MSAPQIDDATFRAQIKADAAAAWTGANACVAAHDDRPRLPKQQADLPYCVVRLEDFRQDKAALRRLSQTYTFEIVYVGRIPSTGILNTLKIELANLLIARLMSANPYAGVPSTRLVTEVRLSTGAQNDAGNAPTFELSVMFVIVADAPF